MKAHSQSCDARVIFYPFTKEDTTKISADAPVSEFMATKEVDVSRSILSVSTTKDKGNPGSFQITLASDRNYKKLLQAGCWCFIYLSDRPLTGQETNTLDSGLKMVGIVKSIRRIERTDHRGSRTVTYTISGFDYQAVFNTLVYTPGALLAGAAERIFAGLFFSIAGGYDKVEGDSKVKFKLKARPDVLVRGFTEYFLGVSDKNPAGSKPSSQPQSALHVGRPFLIPPTVSRRLLGAPAPGNLFTQTIAFYLQDNLIGVNINIPQFANTISIWSLMSHFSHQLLNELYTDLLPTVVNGIERLVPSLILRAQPWSRTALNESVITFTSAKSRAAVSLDGQRRVVGDTKRASYYISKEFDESEIISLETGKSDAERKNFFLITPAGNPEIDQRLKQVANGQILNASSATQNRGFNALADPVSGSRYGLFPYVAETSFFYEGGSIVAMNEISRDMWSHIFLYENGTLECIGQRDHIPVGTNIVLKDRGWMGHAERVSHSYYVSSSGEKVFRTVIGLVNLQTRNGQPIDLVEGTGTEGQIAPWDRGVSLSGNK